MSLRTRYAFTGIVQRTSRTEPVFASVDDDFLAFIGNSKLVIHNAEFNVRFVNAESGEAGLAAIGMDRVLDTLSLARKSTRGRPTAWMLFATATAWTVRAGFATAHCWTRRILVEVYCELTGGRQRALVFGEAARLAAPRLRLPRSGRPAAPTSVFNRGLGNDRPSSDILKASGQEAIWFRSLAQPRGLISSPRERSGGFCCRDRRLRPIFCKYRALKSIRSIWSGGSDPPDRVRDDLARERERIRGPSIMTTGWTC